MSHKVPTILCETCRMCEHIGVARAGNVLVECRLKDGRIFKTVPKAKCECYLPEKEAE